MILENDVENTNEAIEKLNETITELERTLSMYYERAVNAERKLKELEDRTLTLNWKRI